jgi:hypothetical protein
MEEGWQSIDLAPLDGTEVLVYRQDCGILLARFIAPCDFLTERELEALGDDLDEPDWFCADFVQGCRLDADLKPTHFMLLPEPPERKG